MAQFVNFQDKQGKDLGPIIGSPLCGSPISVRVKAKDISVAEGSVLSSHRLVIRVKSALETDNSFIEQDFYTVVDSGEIVEIDISSALRVVADTYEYTHEACEYPRIKFNVCAYDVYRLDGNIYDNVDKVYLPSEDQYFFALQGKYNDIERMLAGFTKKAIKFNNKPSTSPQIVCVGETYAVTYAFDGSEAEEPQESFDGYYLDDLPCGPESVVLDIKTTGLQNIAGNVVYALPATDFPNRAQFRFINHYGVLDSFSCFSFNTQGNDIKAEDYVLTSKESFGNFSRGVVRKNLDKDWLTFSSGYMTTDWADWFCHEFLMAEHVWMLLPTKNNDGLWVRCSIEVKDSITSIDKSKDDGISINFKVVLDVDGTYNPNVII